MSTTTRSTSGRATRKAGVIALAAVGPVAVALIRFVLPSYTSTDNAHAAVAVAAHPATESAVLWLGMVATLTLVPGLYSIRDRMPAGKLRSVGFTVATIGYLCLPGVLATDLLLWVGTDQGMSTSAVGDLADGVHPSALAAMGIFIPTHILGIVLIGVLALRSRLVPAPVAWALTVSQPLHLAAIIVGLPTLDLVAWCATALGMAWLAATAPFGKVDVTDGGRARAALEPA